MRYEITVPMKLIVQSDVAILTLVSDSMIARNRDIVNESPMTGIALARLIAQLTYRLASERYQINDNTITFTVELTSDESKALCSYAQEILDNINVHIEHYEELLRSKKAKKPYVIEQRIAALTIWGHMIEQICGDNYEA